jgi:hypothetical protein
MFCPENYPVMCVTGECKAYPELCNGSFKQLMSSRSSRLLTES